MRALLVLGLLLVACGDDASDGDGQLPSENACGTAGTIEGQECTGLDECGAGESNLSPVSFCEHCFAGADSHVCEAGQCRALDAAGSIRVGFGVPDEAAGAKSFTVAVVLPVMADGTRVSCASLRSAECTTINNRMINTSNSSFQNFVMPDGSADPSFAYTYLTSADVGTDRLVFMTITQDTQGTGAALASGCAEGLEVRAGERTEVSLELTPL